MGSVVSYAGTAGTKLTVKHCDIMGVCDWSVTEIAQYDDWFD